MDKLNLDYNVLYCLFDSLDALGLVGRKSESILQTSSKTLIWHGFKKMKEKHGHIFKLISEGNANLSIDKVILSEKYQNGSFLEKLFKEITFKMLT